MNAQEYYQKGELKEAVTAALDEVKRKPTESQPRVFLAELLCASGDLERADRQLEALGNQDGKAILGVMIFRKLIRAEQARQQFFNEGRVPEFIGLPSPVLKTHLEASILIREGKTKEATDLLAEAETKRPKVTGKCDGQVFDDFRDLDDLTAPFLEVLSSDGRYFWVPFDAIESAEFEPPARPIDLLWRRTRLIVREGPDGVVLVPTLYAGSAADPDDAIKLGRSTDWRGGEGSPVRGLGQRMFLNGENTVSALEIKSLTFDPPAGET